MKIFEYVVRITEEEILDLRKGHGHFPPKPDEEILKEFCSDYNAYEVVDDEIHIDS